MPKLNILLGSKLWIPMVLPSVPKHLWALSFHYLNNIKLYGRKSQFLRNSQSNSIVHPHYCQKISNCHMGIYWLDSTLHLSWLFRNSKSDFHLEILMSQLIAHCSQCSKSPFIISRQTRLWLKLWAIMLNVLSSKIDYIVLRLLGTTILMLVVPHNS